MEAPSVRHAGSQFPERGLNPCSLQWEHVALTPDSQGIPMIMPILHEQTESVTSEKRCLKFQRPYRVQARFEQRRSDSKSVVPNSYMIYKEKKMTRYTRITCFLGNFRKIEFVAFHF